MPEYFVPGVYIEEQSLLGNSVVPVATAVPAFIGYTERMVDVQGNSLELKPTRVSTMTEYQRLYGGPNVRVKATLSKVGNSYAHDVVVEALNHRMFYSLQLYFANGGGPVYIVSVGTYPPTGQAQVALGKLQKGLAALDMVQEVSLLYFPDVARMAPLSPIETAYANRGTIYKDALSRCAQYKDRFLVMDLLEPKEAFWNNIGTANLGFGAVYAPDLLTSLPWQQRDDQVVLAAAVGSTDATLLALDSKTLAEALAITGNAGVSAWVDGGSADRIRASIAALPGPMLPPGGAVLGGYVQTDRNIGVWKAPANIALNAVVGPTLTLTDAEQGELNQPAAGHGKSINAIRSFTGRGTLVWGARTLDGNSNDWRYVSVRRTVIYIEQSLKNALLQFVFEPNDANTWLRIRTMVESYLSNVWRDGGLAGTKPTDAFSVFCGLGQTMDQQDVLNGRLVVTVALAVVRPAEFVEITLTQTLGS